MTVRDLIDFMLALRSAEGLVGFGQLYEDDIAGLKDAVKAHYGSQENWLALPEDSELPVDIAARAESLLLRHAAWKGTDRDLG